MSITFQALSGQLRMDVSQWQQGINQAQRGLSGLAAGVNRVGMAIQNGMNAAANTLSLVGAGLASLGAASLKIGTDFEATMSRVKAISGATEVQFNKLRSTAKKLGEDTVFSARDAAEAMSFFALAGYKAEKIIAAMPATLNLAAAGQISIADAADIAAKIMSGMQIPVGKLDHVMDVLTKAFTTANTDLRQLGEAMKYVGPIANATGQKLEDIVAPIQVLSNAGIQASMAGTSMRQVLSELAQGGPDTRKAMHALGIEFKNSRGVLLPLPDLVDKINARFKANGGFVRIAGENMSKAALSLKMFGDRGGPGFQTLLEAGGSKIREMRKALEGAGGTAERIAKVQLDNLRGSFVILTSALEGVALTAAERMTPAIRQLVDQTTRWITINKPLIYDSIKKLWEGTMAVAESFGRVVVRMKEMVAGGIELSRTFSPMVRVLSAFWDRLPQGAKDLILVGAALRIASGSLGTLGSFIPFIGPLISGLGRLLNPFRLLTGAFTLLRGLLTVALPLIAKFGVGTLAAIGPIGWAAIAIGAVVTGITYLAATSKTFGPQIQRIWQKLSVELAAIWKTLKAGFVELHAAFAKLWQDFKASLENSGLEKFFAADFWGGMVAGAKDAFREVLHLLEGFIDAFSGNFDRLNMVLKPMLAKMARTIGEVLEKIPGLGDSGKSLQEMADAWEAEAQALRDKINNQDAKPGMVPLQGLANPDDVMNQPIPGMERFEKQRQLQRGERGVLSGANRPLPKGEYIAIAGGRKRFGVQEIDPLTASQDSLRSAAGIRNSDIKQRIRSLRVPLSKEQYTALQVAGADVASSTREVANAPMAERQGKLETAQQSFDNFNNLFKKMSEIAALGVDETKRLKDSLKETADAQAEAAKVATQLNEDPENEQLRARHAELQKVITDAEEDTAKAKRLGLDQELSTQNDKKKAHAAEMQRRKDEYEARHKAGKKEAKDIEEGGEEAKKKLEEAGDKAAGAIEGAGEKMAASADDTQQKGQQDIERWQSGTIDAFGHVNQAISNFGDGLNSAAVALGRTFGQEAELYKGLTPQQQMESLLNKKTQELKGAEMNFGFLQRSYGFGGVQSTVDQSRNMTTQQTRIANLKAEISSIQRQISGGQGGMAGMGSPDADGGKSLVRAASSGGNSALGTNVRNSIGDINMTVNTQQVEPGKLFDAMDAEAKKRGMDATGRSPLRKQSRGPINSRIR